MAPVRLTITGNAPGLYRILLCGPKSTQNARLETKMFNRLFVTVGNCLEQVGMQSSESAPPGSVVCVK